MPYIKNKKQRKVINRIIKLFAHEITPNGNLNYFLFGLSKKYCLSYEDYKTFIGELECAKAEIIRRQLSPYEDEKIKKNGDVNIDDL